MMMKDIKSLNVLLRMHEFDTAESKRVTTYLNKEVQDHRVAACVTSTIHFSCSYLGAIYLNTKAVY